MIKVVVVSELKAGGVEKVNTMLAEYLNKDIFDVTVLSVTDKASCYEECAVPFKAIFLEAPSIKRSLFSYLKALRTLKPDIIVTSILDETAYALLYKKLFAHNAKVVYVQHTVWSRVCSLSCKGTIFNVILPRLVRLFRRIDAIVYVSNGVKEDMQKSVRNISAYEKVIYNPITATDEYYRYKSIDKDKFSIVTIGRLEQEKQQSTIVDAVKILTEQGKDVSLYIYGVGSLKESLYNQAKSLGVEHKVHFMGYSDHIQENIRDYDIFVLSSIYESFGNVIVEAMNVGLPVVSTDCPVGPNELLENGRYGTLVPIGCAESMAQAIGVTAASTTEEIVKAAFQRSMFFSLSQSITQYEELFKTLLVR